MRFLSFLSRFDTVTILRGVACLIIIAIHAPIPSLLIDSQVGFLLTAIGFIAISMFFFLSGFVLGKGYLSNKYQLTFPGILKFYGRRIKKIAPIYYLIILILFTLTPKTTPIRIIDIVRLLTFTATPKITIYSSSYLWFVSTIMQLYFLAPVGFLILKTIKTQKLRLRIILFITVLIFGILVKSAILFNAANEILNTSWQMNIDIFALGMLLAASNTDVYTVLKTKPRMFRGLLLVMTFTIFFVLYLFGSIYIHKSATQTLKSTHLDIVMPFTAILISSIVLSVFPIRRVIPNLQKNSILTSAVVVPQIFLQTIGLYSYKIYLLHQPLFSILNLPCSPICTVLMFIKNITTITVIAVVISVTFDIVTVGLKMLFVRVKNLYLS